MPRPPHNLPLILFGAAALTAAYAWWVEPGRLDISEHVIETPESDAPDGLPAPPVRVLLLTDWHLGRWSRPRSLAAKMRRLDARQARRPFDVVLLGGDYLDAEPRYLGLLAPMLGSLGAWGVPILAVAGNHDYSSAGGDFGPVERFLESHGVRVLRGGAAAVTARGRRLLVVGLDDLQESPAYYSPGDYKTPEEYRAAAQRLDWYARFDGLEPDTPRIILAHNPDAVHLPGRAPLAVLSGHTHGGQVMLLDWVSRPLHRWIHPHLPPGSFVTWAGRKRVGGRTLIVSRGMDGSALPLRLLRPPEVVAVTLR